MAHARCARGARAHTLRTYAALYRAPPLRNKHRTLASHHLLNAYHRVASNAILRMYDLAAERHDALGYVVAFLLRSMVTRWAVVNQAGIAFI